MGFKFSRVKLAEEVVSKLDENGSNEALAKQVAAFLIEAGKTSELNSLTRDVVELRAKQKKVVELTATSAHPLSDDQRQEIESSVIKHYGNVDKIIINHQIDKDVIGGISLTFANANLDLTVRAKLNKLRELTAN